MEEKKETPVNQTGVVENKIPFGILSETQPKQAGNANDDKAWEAEMLEIDKQVAESKTVPSYQSPVQLIPAHLIKPKPISWLISKLLARSMITLLAGVAGEGKTTLALWFAALVSNGGEFNGQKTQEGKVLIWSGEDSAEYVLAPRLRAQGANLRNIDFVGSKTFESGEIRPFDITTDIPLIESTIEKHNNPYGLNYSLVIIDPIMSVVLGDPHKSSHVRQSIEPLREMAERQGVAVLGITHFSKGASMKDPQDRVIGSQAFAAVSRAVLGLVRNEETGIRRLVILKSNITETNVGYDFEYKFYTDMDGCSVAGIDLVGMPSGSARELMAEFEPQEADGGVVADAKEFLEGLLHDAPLPVKQVKADADGAGFSWDAIRRAAQRLGVEKRKDLGSNGVWRWALPSD